MSLAVLRGPQSPSAMKVDSISSSWLADSPDSLLPRFRDNTTFRDSESCMVPWKRHDATMRPRLSALVQNRANRLRLSEHIGNSASPIARA